MKQQAALSVCEATGYSNISMCLHFNGKPVRDEGGIFDYSGEFVNTDSFTLQAALSGAGDNNEGEAHKVGRPKKVETEAERRARLDKRNAKQREKRQQMTETARDEELAKKRTASAKARGSDESDTHRLARLERQKVLNNKVQGPDESNTHRLARLQNKRIKKANAKADKAVQQLPNTQLMDDDTFQAYTRVDALKSPPEFWHSYKTDARKNLLLYLWNSGHAYLPNYNRIEHGDPQMLDATWDDATQADGLLKDLRDAIRNEIISPELKLQRLAAYNELVSLEAELPSCSCCGIRTYPDNSGTERPLTRPGPKSETARSKQSFVVLPISDPRFDRLKVTEEQLTEHRATRRYRTVFRHNRTDYHLYPDLVLPAAPGSAAEPDSEPHLVVCSACFSRLPRPKPASATAPGSKRSRAGSDSDDGDSDSSNSDQDERATESKDSDEPPPLPHNSVAAGYEYGRLRHLPPLTLIETAILAKVIPYGAIVKLKEWRGVSQRALTGQTICFPSDGPEAAASFAANRFKTQFPFHSNATLAEHVRVSFVGPANQAKDYINILMQPDGPLYFKAADVIQWLRVLRVTHPNYTDIVIPSEAELEATLAPLRQLIVDQAQVVDDETARFMESAKIGTDIAGVRSVCVDEDTANANGAPCDAAAGQPSSSQAATGEAEVHLNGAGVPDRLPLVMSDVVIIDGTNRDEDPDQRLLDALNATMRKQPTDDSEAPAAEPDSLFCRRGDDPVNDFENRSELLTCAFPHVFPFGVGVPRSSLSPKFTRYLMLHHSNVFANEPRLYFLLFNQLQRSTNCHSTSLRVKAQRKHIDAVTRITRAPTFMPRLEAANANPDSFDSKRLLASLHPHIITLGSKTPFSPSARKASFNHLLAGLNRSLSLTLCPYLHHCILRLHASLCACVCVCRFGTGQLFVTMAFNEVCSTVYHVILLQDRHTPLNADARSALSTD